MQLAATDYGNFLANEPLPISTSTIAEKATQVLVDQFNYLRNNAVEPLSKFLEYMTYVLPSSMLKLKLSLCYRYAYMIDNVVLLITGTLHERNTNELIQRCHPLGVFDTMPALCVATTVDELYQTVLVETPLGVSNSFFLTYRLLTLHQHLISETAYQRPILMTSTLRSSGILSTKRTSRISTPTPNR